MRSVLSKLQFLERSSKLQYNDTKQILTFEPSN